MRKFTKEIAALIAAAAVSSSVSTAAATSEEIVTTAGVSLAPTEEYPPVDGGMMLPDDYIEPTTTEEFPPLAGDPMPPDEYIEPTTEEEFPPLAGIPLPPDAYIKPTILGDANCDDAVSMADAAAIYQHLGNSDKYALSEQGEANSDVDGNEGLTAADAIAIQKFNAKLIEELPETEINN